jgi:hypothetical protein
LAYFDGSEMFASDLMKAMQGDYLTKPGELFWRLSNLMRIPNASGDRFAAEAGGGDVPRGTISCVIIV